MLRLKLIIIVLLIIFASAAKSQINKEARINRFGASMFYMPEPGSLIGSPYENPNWMPGSIISGFDTIEAHIRYNVFQNRIEFIYEMDSMYIDKPWLLSYVCIMKKTYIYSFYIEEKGKSQFILPSYFELLNHGEVKLLKKHIKKFNENTYVRNYMGGGGDGRQRYNSLEHYYLKLNDSAAVKIRLNLKYIVEKLGRHEHLNSFIKQNGLKNNQNDILKLIAYYNEFLLNSKKNES